MNNLISSHLMGGLGNQMFQIAHAHSQGLKHNRPVIFKSHSWTPLQGKDTSFYKENIFRNINFSNDNYSFDQVSENEFYFQNLRPSENNTIFSGYFQSSKNFFGFYEEIKNLFSPTEKFIENVYKKYPQIVSSNSVSIHMRIGDYAKNPNIHPIISKSYIDRALNELSPHGHVFVFGDDKEFMKRNFIGKEITIVDEEDWYELWMMSLCKNNIIANSTFSWWGAFLNKNLNRKIFVPSIWFGPDGPQNYSDIFENDWRKINVKLDSGKLIYG